MALEFNPAMLQGPIPGMSLTQEPGNMPWENPPELSNIHDVMAFYLERLTDDDAEDALLFSLDEGVAVDMLADYITTSGTMNGRHSLDLAFLVNPYVRELIMYIAEACKVDYVESYEKREAKNKLPYRKVREVIKEVFEEDLKPVIEEKEQKPIKNLKGLMARKNVQEEV